MGVSTNKERQVSSGVESLIQRLKKEGVEQGREEAEKIRNEAIEQAQKIIRGAKSEAEAIVQNARDEAKKLETSGKESLHIAARDTVLDMKSMLMQRFTSDMQRLVSAEMKQKDLIQRIILEIVRRTRQDVGIRDDEDMEVILPRDVVGLEDLRRKPDKFEEDTLTQFVRSLTGDILREGIHFKASDDSAGGIRVRLTERNIEIDINEESVSAILLEHLQPRFRALLEGIVK